MAKIIDDKIHEFIDNLWEENYVYIMKGHQQNEIVHIIKAVLKPYIRKFKEAE